MFVILLHACAAREQVQQRDPVRRLQLPVKGWADYGQTDDISY